MRKRSETIVVSIAVLGTLICVCLGGCGDKKAMHLPRRRGQHIYTATPYRREMTELSCL